MMGNRPWDAAWALRRMGKDYVERNEATCRQIALVVNATAGLTIRQIYDDPLDKVLEVVYYNVRNRDLAAEHLLGRGAHGAALRALDALLLALPAEPHMPTLRALIAHPATYPNLLPRFVELDRVATLFCAPFVHPGFDPVFASESLDTLLELLGPDYTYGDLYERAPTTAMAARFNRVMVRAKRAGLLVELAAIRRPPGRGYVSDPADDRWDVRSTVPPENAVLFKSVHQKINTMAYLMTGMNYGNFFDLPLVHEKVLPHIQGRVLADSDYWFTEIEKKRIAAALDDILTYLRQSVEHGALTFRTLYSEPDVPAEVLIGFQRILDVKPEICLPFMDHDFDHAAAAEAIDVYLEAAAHLDLKRWYTAPEGRQIAHPDVARMQRLHQAALTLQKKGNDLYCRSRGDCVYCVDEWCSTEPLGNCPP